MAYRTYNPPAPAAGQALDLPATGPAATTRRPTAPAGPVCLTCKDPTEYLDLLGRRRCESCCTWLAAAIQRQYEARTP